MGRKEEADFIAMHCSVGGAEESGSLADVSSVLVPAAPHGCWGAPAAHRAECAGGEEREQGRGS